MVRPGRSERHPHPHRIPRAAVSPLDLRDVTGVRASRSWGGRMRTILILGLAALSASAQNIGIDTHIDTAQRVLIEGVDLAERLKDGQVDIPRLREGGMNAPFFA